MLRRPWLLNLVLLAAILGAGARLGAIWRTPPPQVAGQGIPAAPGERAGGERAPGPGAGGEAEAIPAGEDFSLIAAKDLFSQARGAPAPAPPKTAAPAAPPKAPPKVALFGVVIVDGDKSAFLQEGGGDQKPRRVREGEGFAGGTLREIRPDGVTLVFSGTEVSVALRTPKEGLPAIPVPGAPAGAPGAVNRRFPPAARQPAAARAPVAVPAAPAQRPRFTPPPRAGQAEEPFDDEEFYDDEDLLTDEELEEEFLDDEEFDDFDDEDEEY